MARHRDLHAFSVFDDLGIDRKRPARGDIGKFGLRLVFGALGGCGGGIERKLLGGIECCEIGDRLHLGAVVDDGRDIDGAKCAQDKRRQANGEDEREISASVGSEIFQEQQ